MVEIIEYPNDFQLVGMGGFVAMDHFEKKDGWDQTKMQRVKDLLNHPVLTARDDE